MRALTGLRQAGLAVQNDGKGKPLEMLLADILPDPANTRNADDENTPAAIEAQEQLNGDVEERGVKTPISIRPHPAFPGKYIINYGHRRYKAASANGMTIIPAFVDEKFDSYDQVNENELRTGMTTRARALFIKSKLEAGDSKGKIAQRMRRKNQNFITEHLALLDAPDCVNKAYANGITSARTLYDLRQAYEEFPESVEAWCNSGVKITRDTIKAQQAQFRHDEKTRSEAGEVPVIVETSSPIGLTVDQHDDVMRVLNGHEVRSASANEVTVLAVLKPGGAVPDSTFRHNEIDGNEVAASPKIPDFRHDEKMPLGGPQEQAVGTKFRHGEEKRQEPPQRQSSSSLGKVNPAAGGIVVQYKGKLARIAPNTTVTIIVDGRDVPLDVPLSELVFKK